MKIHKDNIHQVKDKAGEVLRLDDDVEVDAGPRRAYSGHVIGFGDEAPYVMVEDMEGDVHTEEAGILFSDRGADRLVAEAEAKRA